MKKLFLLVAFVAMGFVGLGSGTAHASGCQNVHFSDADVCVRIEKTSNSYYRVRADINNSSSNAIALTCDLMTPDNVLRNVGACDQTFSYSERNIGTVVLYMQLNGQNKTLSQRYDFSYGDWTNSSNNNNYDDCGYWNNYCDDYYYDNNDDCGYWNNYCDDYYYDDNNNDCYYYNDCYGNDDVDNFYLTTDDSTPSTSQRVDLTIKARDYNNYTLTDYRGTVRFRVYYRSSSSSSWTETTSSTYYESNFSSSYTFSSSNNGQKTLTDFIRFKKNNYDYKIRVYDDNNSSIYKEITFNVGSSSNNNDCYYYNDCYNNSDLANFYITVDDTTPSVNQRVDLTVKARDYNNYTLTDYNGSIDYRIYYRSSSSSSWTETTSSSYYEINSSYDYGYDFDSYDNGVAQLNNFIRFKRDNYDYKVRIYDQDDSSIYKEITFDVGSSSNNDDCYYYDDCYDNNSDLANFYVTADDTTPSVNQRVDLTVKARDYNNYTLTDYNGSIDYRIYYRSSSSSSWTETTSSSYYEINSSYDYGYDFDSYDNGIAQLNNFIRFKRDNYDYKIRIYDQDDSSIYKEITFNVGSSSNNDDCYYYDDCYDNNSNGFTTSQINQIKNIYNLWPSLIANMESSYPRLRTNTTRQRQEEDLYTQMYNITRDRASLYDNYDDFFDAFRSWYVYTLQVR